MAIRGSRSCSGTAKRRRRSRIRIDVFSDEARFALPVAFQLLLQLGIGQAGRQLLRAEIGGDNLKQIMVGRADRRAGAAEAGNILGAPAADKFAARLAGLALGERS